MLLVFLHFRSNALVGSGITLSPDGDGYYTGVITATKYEGDGSALTGIAKQDRYYQRH